MKSQNPKISLRMLCERHKSTLPAVESQPQNKMNDLQESLFNIAFENQQPLAHPNDSKFTIITSIKVKL